MKPSSDKPRPILVVDDDEDAHFFLKRQLARCGSPHRIDSALNGEDAVEYFKDCFSGSQPLPQLVFLDVKMPGMNGLEVLGWLRTNGFLSQTTVSMLTSSDDPKDVGTASELGVHAYLLKTPTDAQIIDILRNAASRTADVCS